MSIDNLASSPDDLQVARLDPAIFARLRDQAQIQIATQLRSDDRPAHRVRPTEQQGKGLAMLPAPDAGDIWFDMEGYPDPVSGEKLEYLFGACFYDEKGSLQYVKWWAHNPEEEKQAFDGFVQWVLQRRERYPDLHVYHTPAMENGSRHSRSLHQLHVPLIDSGCARCWLIFIRSCAMAF